MSVKRYTNGADDDQGMILPFMEESPDGDYVEYADYQALQAKNERLRKAGDAMERSLAFAYPDSPKIKDWNAAKEGKQS